MKKNYLFLKTRQLLYLLSLATPLAAMAGNTGSEPRSPFQPTEPIGGCAYEILESPRCANQNLAQVWLKNDHDNYFSVTRSASFVTYDNGTAHYTATASNGSDTVEVAITFSGYTTTPPQDSPKENWCSPHDATNWAYWTETTGTVVSEQHGTYTLTRKGPAFQLGDWADVTRAGFGASGWFDMSGGDGFYTTGDINIQLGDCTPLCTLKVDAGADVEVCAEDSVELTATIANPASCSGGCEYPIEESAKCGSNGANIEEVWIENPINNRFNKISSSFVTYKDGTARYNGVASNGTDTVEVDLTFSGYTTTPPQDSPKENWCSPHNTSDWVYYTETNGTLVSELHGTFNVTRKGPAFQMGDGADVTREGFGASGWLMISGGDGYYENGDVNVKLGSCIPIDFTNDVAYVWTTEDGNIVGDASQKTIKVDQSGTYKVVAKDCLDCEAIDEVKVNLSNPEAGTITANADAICVEEESVVISATPDGNTYVPADYLLGYVLTTGPDLVVQELSDTPEFIVDQGGKYTIHPFVYPVSFDPLSVVVPGQTTGTDVNALLVQGGGALCASLDLVGAMVMVQEQVVIGDYVWSDANQNGVQDDTEQGVNGVSVSLFSCEGEKVNETMTGDDVNGNAGYYQFEVCPNSGSYYIVFSDVPENYVFTDTRAGDDTMVDSNANTDGRTECFEVTDVDDLSIDAGLISTCPQLIVQYKIRPRDTDGIYTPGNETAACLGDDLIIRMVMPGDGNTYEEATVFTDWVFTFANANGGVAIRGTESEPINNYISRYGLEENDFGLYKISWVSPDGCTGEAEFVLNFPDEGCNADGIRANDANKVASVFPMPATSGSTVQLVINTDTGSVATDKAEIGQQKPTLPAVREKIVLSLYEMNSGRMVGKPQTFDITQGRDVIEYELNQLSTGVYILRVDGTDWSDSRQLVIQ